MESVTRQLEAVRSTARRLLLAQSALRWLAAALAALIAAGLLDFALRLPPSIRLVLGLGAAAAGLAWLVRSLCAAATFKPGLSTLAIRAERLYPHLSGELASGVDFST